MGEKRLVVRNRHGDWEVRIPGAHKPVSQHGSLDDAPRHSGAYFSQSSILYRDKQCRAGGWPMQTPNPNAKNIDTARRLVAISYDLVGLDKPS